MIIALVVGFAALALVIALGLDGIRKQAARSANAQSDMADALHKIAAQAAVIEMRQRDIQIEQMKLGAKVATIKNDEVRREVEGMIANGARVLDG